MALIPICSMLAVAGSALAITSAETRVLPTDPPVTDGIVVVEGQPREVIVVEGDAVVDGELVIEGEAVVEGQGSGGRYIARVVTGQPATPTASKSAKAITTGVFHINQNSDDEEIEIRIEGDKIVKFTRNGNKVNANTFEMKDGNLFIYDDDGKVLHEHKLHIATPALPAPPSGLPGPGGRRIFMADEDGNFSVNVGPGNAPIAIGSGGGAVTWTYQPKVMLGITQDVPSPALRFHLGLDDDQKCILIENVIPGLPAAKAGMQRYDIVLKADDASVDSQVLRELLAEKADGDEVVFKVLRKGNTKELTIELEAYDADKLGISRGPAVGTGGNFFVVPRTPDAPGVPGPSSWVEGFDNLEFPGESFEFEVEDLDLGEFEFEMFADPEQTEEAVQKLRQRIEKSSGIFRLDGNKLIVAPEVQGHATRIRTRVQEDAEKMRAKALEMAEQAGEDAEVLIGRVAPQAEARLDQIESRLEKLEGTLSERLERLFERLDSISDRLKDASEESEEEI